MRQIFFLAQAEVLHIVRDRILLAQTLIVPMVQLLILSNAATFEIRNTPIQIVDPDRSSTSRGVVNHLAANGHFDIVDTTASLDRADERLDVAIQGDGFFEVQMPDGTKAYTRDGALKTASDGRITTSDGLVLQGGFQPIPAGTTSISIARRRP